METVAGNTTNVHFDESDPITVVLTWALTWVLSKVFDRFGWKKLRHLLPLAAVLLAVGIRTVFDTFVGEPLSGETALRALAAGGVAVLSHAQFREAMKALPTPSKNPETPTDPEQETAP